MTDVLAPRNWTKAEVRREQRANQPVIVKDYRRCGWVVRRLYGRPTLRREARAYRRLAGVRGVPACLGFDGPDALVVAFAPGRSLRSVNPGELPEAVFVVLDRVLAEIHARGVAITDLHRANVIVDDAGNVQIVDFAVARLARRPARPGWLLRRLQQLDRHAAARLRAHFLRLPEPHAAGLFGWLYRTLRRLKP